VGERKELGNKKNPETAQLKKKASLRCKSPELQKKKKNYVPPKKNTKRKT